MQKGMSKFFFRNRKWGLGLPKHIKLFSILMNMLCISNNFNSYILLVLIYSLMAIPCICPCATTSAPFLQSLAPPQACGLLTRSSACPCTQYRTCVHIACTTKQLANVYTAHIYSQHICIYIYIYT